MAGKNDVEMVIRARDAVGPGVDSAKQKLRSLSKDMGGGGGMLDSALKVGAVVNALDGAFTAATAGVKLFQGDLDGAVDALKQMPLGIGGVVSAMEGLFDAIDGTADKLADFNRHAARFKEITQGEFKLTTQFLDIEDQLAVLREADEFDRQRVQARLERRKMEIAALEAGATREDGVFKKIAELNQVKLDNIDAAEREAEQKRIEKLRADLEKEQAVRDEAIRRRLERSARAAEQESALEAMRIRQAMDDDDAAIEAAMRRLRDQRGGASSLPAGEQSRFLTGVAQAGQSKIEAIQQKQVDIAQKQLEKLEQMRQELAESQQPANPAVQLNIVGSGIFQGLS